MTRKRPRNGGFAARFRTSGLQQPRIEYRWGAGNGSRYHKFAAELVALSPDAILAIGGTAIGVLQQASRTVPIVFVDTTDPVNRGLVATMARPGGNTTGFRPIRIQF